MEIEHVLVEGTGRDEEGTRRGGGMEGKREMQVLRDRVKLDIRKVKGSVGRKKKMDGPMKRKGTGKVGDEQKIV